MYAYVEFEVTGGPMRFTLRRTAGVGAFCENEVQPFDNSEPVTSPLQPGHDYYETFCGGGVGLTEGSFEIDAEVSSELHVFR